MAPRPLTSVRLRGDPIRFGPDLYAASKRSNFRRQRLLLFAQPRIAARLLWLAAAMILAPSMGNRRVSQGRSGRAGRVVPAGRWGCAKRRGWRVGDDSSRGRDGGPTYSEMPPRRSRLLEFAGTPHAHGIPMQQPSQHRHRVVAGSCLFGAARVVFGRPSITLGASSVPPINVPSPFSCRPVSGRGSAVCFGARKGFQRPGVC